MGILNRLFGYTQGRYRSPNYFVSIGECDYDCLACLHLDIDCEGDVLEDEELFHELYDDDEDWYSFNL